MTDNSLKPLIVITGASSGIGEACAFYLSENRDVRLLLIGRNLNKLNDVKSKCLSLGCKEIDIYKCDLSDSEELHEFCKYARQKGNILALVNNAGFGSFGPTQTFDEQILDKIFAVNIRAPFLIAQQLYVNLSNNGRVSSIINIGSDADYLGFSEAAAYCASKGGLKLFGRSLRKEWRTNGIRVATISPGRVDTHFNNKKPGMRIGALQAEEVAQVVDFAIFCNENIELQEILLDSMNRLDE